MKIEIGVESIANIAVLLNLMLETSSEVLETTLNLDVEAGAFCRGFNGHVKMANGYDEIDYTAALSVHNELVMTVNRIHRVPVTEIKQVLEVNDILPGVTYAIAKDGKTGNIEYNKVTTKTVSFSLRDLCWVNFNTVQSMAADVKGMLLPE